MKIALLFTTIFLTTIAFGQDKPAYKIYTSKGKEVSFKKMVQAIGKSDITLFGELHNNAISHWLQLELIKEMHKTRKLALGAEMIEADNQDELDDYLSGKIDAKALDSTARLWPNHDTDYAPLVDFAKENQLSFTGTNIPRRYANLVYKKGFGALDSLTAEELAWIAPLPIAFDPSLPQYQNILSMMGEHGTPELVMAQAIKDATMAHFILQNYKQDELYIHFNGAYHSNFYEGILWYLKLSQPDKSYITISTVEQVDINSLEAENKGVADFIICVDEDVTKTY